MIPRKPIEVDYVNAFLVAASFALPGVRFFKRNTGMLKIPGAAGKADRFFRASIPGQCDIWAVRRTDAKHFEIEAKNISGSLNEAQLAWKAWCHSFGVPWLLVRVSKDETPAATVERWVAEVSRFTA